MSLTGNLRTMPLPEILQWIGTGRKGGTLHIGKGALQARLMFRDGSIQSSVLERPAAVPGAVPGARAADRRGAAVHGAAAPGEGGPAAGRDRLAHAMMNDPAVLVLDEPTSGLDPNQIVEIREIIKRIGKAKTVVFSTHILSEAEATCDRVAIIHRGKIVADSSTARLKETLGSRSHIHLTLEQSEAGAVEREIGSVAGVLRTEVLDRTDGQLRLLLTCEPSADPRAEIYRRIRRTDWVLLEFHQETQTLEAIFRELTKES